jgi:hypothetical protein
MVEIKINYNDPWTSLPLSALLLFYKKNNIPFRFILLNESQLTNCILIEDNLIGKSILIDCNDSPKVFSNLLVDRYFKRSYIETHEYHREIIPLGFTFGDYSMSSHVIRNLCSCKGYFKKLSSAKNVQIEAFRSLDILGIFTNANRASRNRLKWQTNFATSNNKILYKTRLWNPNNVQDILKRDQRVLMNNWRISMVELLNSRFPNNSICGIQKDGFSSTIARSEILIATESMKMRQYVNEFTNCGIGIADDGLEDTLGWKIGELVYTGKALVSTEIKVKLPGEFNELTNYLSVNRVFDEKVVGDSIEKLLSDDVFREEMSQQNLNYAHKYLHDYKMAEYIYSMI